MKRLLARLVYDTRAQPLPKGVRLVTLRARRLLFAADRFEIPVQVSPGSTPDTLNLMGQVLIDGVPVTAAAVRLRGSGAIIARETDADGEFRVVDLPRGSFVAEIEMPEETVAIETMNLADPPPAPRAEKRDAPR